jgi:uncharacterized protein YegP (UPF0339 family)
MKIKPHIIIKDARKRWREEGKQKEGRGYRVCLVAHNGEMLMQSEVLNTPHAVGIHIRSLVRITGHKSEYTTGWIAAKTQSIELVYYGTNKYIKSHI